MDKKNFVIFLAIITIMMALSYVNMKGSDSTLVSKGRPVVREAFSEKDYKTGIVGNRLIVQFSAEVANEYEGRFLSVYAYDASGNHITKTKRVVNGHIVIGEDENPSFNATFRGATVDEINKPDHSLRFVQVFRQAEENGRNFGVEKCLMGKRCIAICPASAIETLIRDDDNNGRIIPNIDYGRCIQGGLCASRCPTNLIVT